MTAVEAGDTDAYALVYVEQHPRLVAYARTLTGDSWQAEDLVAEAHFRVWRRLSTGHRVENAPAYLTAVVRNLAATVDPSAAREIPDDNLAAVAAVGQQHSCADDPARRVTHMDLLGTVLKQLPERWVRALWLSEAEGQPLEAVGRQLGTSPNATAVLLNRAREGLRQAFLRALPGTPADPGCAGFWNRLPARVRDSDSPRHAAALRAHTEECSDCHARMLLLTRANTRLPALVGPALLIVSAGEALRFLGPAATGAGAGAAAMASVTGVGAGAGVGVGGAAMGVGAAAAAGAAGIAVIGAAIAVTAVMVGGSPADTEVRPPSQRATIGSPSLAADVMSSGTAAGRAASPGPALTATSVPPVLTTEASAPPDVTTLPPPATDPTTGDAAGPTQTAGPQQKGASHGKAPGRSKAGTHGNGQGHSQAGTHGNGHGKGHSPAPTHNPGHGNGHPQAPPHGHSPGGTGPDPGTGHGHGSPTPTGTCADTTATGHGHGHAPPCGLGR